MLDQLRPILPATADAPSGTLRIGGVGVDELAEAYGTPVIAYDGAHVEAAARAWLDAFADHPAGATVAYATKAFSSVGMLRLLGCEELIADSVERLAEIAVCLARDKPRRNALSEKIGARLPSVTQSIDPLIALDEFLRDAITHRETVPAAAIARSGR